MRYLIYLICLLMFAFMFTTKPVDPDTKTGTLLRQEPPVGNTFTFEVTMTGSSKHPDLGFETLVKTYVKRELRKLPDVKVVPAGEYGQWQLHIIGWETTTDSGVKTGNIALSSVATIGGAFQRTAFFEHHLLQTGARDNLEEFCTVLVGIVDEILDKYRK